MIEEEVEVPHLPTSFDGAKILYVSDTHKRKLKQKDLENVKKRWTGFSSAGMLRKKESHGL
ncbi:hypothetical protein MT997_25695 [Paenibacillus sp. OVF10]|nr:hypothetical protein MT997_25695 [Paenibacillus sp. OVF10]